MEVKSNFDMLDIDPDQIGKEQISLIPEGEQLFSIYNMYYGKMNSRPKGKRRSTDFRIPLNIQYAHMASGLLITALNNGAEDPFNRMLFFQVVGEVDTRSNFYDFMKAVNAPFYKTHGNAGIYHVIKPDGSRIFTPYDDPEHPGPLGLPVKLLIIHKEVPVLKAKEGAEKNQYGRFEKEDLEPVIENGKPVTRIKEFIEVTQPQSDDYVDRMTSGWPILYKMTEAEKKKRGEYYRPDQNEKPQNDEETPDTEPEDNVKW